MKTFKLGIFLIFVALYKTDDASASHYTASTSTATHAPSSPTARQATQPWGQRWWRSGNMRADPQTSGRWDDGLFDMPKKK